MIYEIFCLTLFIASAIIPTVVLLGLVLIGLTHLYDRYKECRESEVSE